MSGVGDTLGGLGSQLTTTTGNNPVTSTISTTVSGVGNAVDTLGTGVTTGMVLAIRQIPTA
ncbi:MAG: hypothetical protein ACK5JN_04505 [Kluyvera sp.]|uniref:hypothetical protein n=1 Tax=Kluyvera sp. TaxID=1538228 RepID=UPI003A83F5F4